MSAEHAVAPPVTSDPGLWHVRWFRVLTIINSTIVLFSAVGAAIPSSTATGWFFIAFPVVPALFAMPFAWFVLLAFAVVFSAVSMLLGPGRRGPRFLRALTVWGTIYLGTPIAVTSLGAVIVFVGDLVT
ncbi:hypothetical protein GCM10009775_19340 [Microbacterium aoyamense]|uniref:Uncharacterized protein n=1 Tax=Microbacterium aoyamense TaxID=344166 RepID=A0ABN2PQ22_9MICO|nr:hypothetical protein [Microbacterium aoyamense]